MLLLAVFIALIVIAPVRAQEIADIDYEHLSFRGIALEFGYIWPDRVENTETYGIRVDMGYAGPGLRIVPSATYWRSQLKNEEIVEFEERMIDLVAEQNDGFRPELDLGSIRYSSLALGVDAHIVWEVPFDLLTFGGLGLTAHIMDGIDPGFNLHLGAEYPVTNGMRLYTVGRYELMPDLQYFQVRVGWQFMTGPNAPGEGRGDG